MMEFIDLKSQYKELRENIDRRVADVMKHGQYILGPEVYELEEKLADYVGVKHCITVANGTDGLLIAMMALGVGPGDEVITSPFSFIATAEMIMLLGAKPVFVDIDAQTYNLDVSLLEQAITPKTKLILPVNLYGQCADFDPINAIAARRGISVIEDAAQSFGATYKGRMSGGLSIVGSTSFYPSKPLGCYGDGGANFTSDDKLAEKMRKIRNHGQESTYHHVLLGLNSRLATMQAAILLAKLELLNKELKQRAKIASKYNMVLPEHIVLPYIEPHNSSVFAQYTIQIENRDYVRSFLRKNNIPTAVHYPTPMHKQPVLSHFPQQKKGFPVSEHMAQRVLSLPFHPYLKDREIEKVAEVLGEAMV